MNISKLPSKTLQELAFRCGLSQSGTKAILAGRLQAAAHEYKPLPPDSRILSIDLGLRNFAFSLLTLPSSSPLCAKHTGKIPVGKAKGLVTLHAWKHINLLLDHDKTTENVDDPFSPARMSLRAIDLVREHLLPLRPTHVLIERQRFRSANRAAVLEWTIRVNTLEAMLYAAFATLRTFERGAASWEGDLIGVPPQRVTKYLIGEGQGQGDGGMGQDLVVEGKIVPLPISSSDGNISSGDHDGGSPSGRIKFKEAKSKAAEAVEIQRDEGKSRPKRATKADHKLQKIQLLESVFRREPSTIELGNREVSLMAEAFTGVADNDQKQKKPSRRRSVKEVGDGLETGTWTKRDDLCDCLLQGVVWLEWQKNIEVLRKTVFT